ncbi:serine/threonine-protein kinase [Hyalangium sp.]|uniref:serine/threonine protein kinase n=1 Tax=Hyalangium sp. TaxID=2028555 RepID=UPI002D5307FB|nr:serine/threonine-protein kinase [Hyalangium sp.]HYH97939.1 serine/threonine-protein kinase [Hyalangium sp.]
MTPRLFGSYELLKRFAVGSTAELWIARPREGGAAARNLIIKRLLPHLEATGDFAPVFLEEAQVGAHLHHPNLVEIYESGELQHSHYIAREFVQGEPLSAVLRKAEHTPSLLTPALALRITASVCAGLHHAHTRLDSQGRPLKLVHRELTARDILMGVDGAVKVSGFGTSKIADQIKLQDPGIIQVQFESLAPEQVSNQEPDPRTDLFATGLVLYELLTTIRPFQRDTERATVQAVLEDDPLPPSQVAEVPAVLDPVVMKALAKARDDRYQDASEFQRALEECLAAQRWEAGSAHLSVMMETLFTPGAGRA